MRFKIVESVRIFEFEIMSESGQNVTADCVDIFETVTGFDVPRVDANSDDYETHDYVVHGSVFEFMLEWFDDELEKQPEDIKDRLFAWDDYRMWNDD